MNRMFSTLTVKSFDEDSGIIKGIASTPTTDKVGDVVEPMGAEFNLPLPLHHEHDRKDVVGTVTEAKATPEGIEFTAQIAKDVSDQINEVWRRVKAGLIPFVSVGFRAIEHKAIKGGIHFTKWAWDELSLTTIPANAEARITAIKSTTKPAINLEVSKMNVSDQIKGFEAQKAATKAKMTELVTKGITLEGDDEAAYLAAEAELASIEKHLARLQSLEAEQAKSAKPVQAAISVQSNAQPGTDFVRYVKACALGRGNPMMSLEIAKGLQFGTRVENVIKAAVAAGSTTDAGFVSLIEPANLTSEFLELLRPELIVTRLSGVRRVPENIKFLKATTGTSAGWIGEGKAAPITNAAFSDMEVGAHKIGAIAVFTEELLRRSEPSAEALVRDDMLATLAQAIDLAFIDQANAGVAGVKPAAITNAAATAATTGVTATHVRNDVKAAYAAAVAANQPLSSAVWIMHPSTALALSMMRHATSGQREFPGVDFVTGGNFEGLPVVLSVNVPGNAGAGYDVVLCVQNEVFMAEGGLAIDASREASLEMDSAPAHDSKTPTPAQLVSLWQTGSYAIKAIRGITWTRRRPTAVYRISAVKWA